GRDQLLHAEPQAALFGVDFEHLRLHHLVHLEDVLRMVDALLGADVADVDHALHAFGHLHEGAELLQTDHRAVHHRACRKALQHVGPRIAERLLETERDAAIGLIDAEYHDIDLVAGLHHVRRLAHLLGPRHLGEVDESLDAALDLDERAEIGYA